MSTFSSDLPERPWRRWRPWIVLSLVLLPVCIGAAVVQLDGTAVAEPSSREVAVVSVSDGVAQAGLTSGTETSTASTPARFGDALATSKDFEWTELTVDQARRELHEGTLLAAVLVPPGLGSPTGGADGGDRITIVAGRGDPTAYADLSRAVTATAARIGVDDVVVPLSRARIDLNVAFLTANGIKGAVSQAESTFTEALSSVDSLIAQSDPLVANAQILLDGIRQNTAVLDDLSETLTQLSNSVAAVDVTVGDIKRGAEVTSREIDIALGAITETSEIRRQISEVARSVLAQWPKTGIAEFDQLAAQLSTVVDLTGGDSDATILTQLDGGRAAADILSEQLGQLSALLGRPVGDQTRLSELLLLTVDRLSSVRELLAMGNDTVDRVIEQLNGAKTQLPQTKRDIRAQLDKFNSVSAQLVQSLDKGIDGLPSTSSSAPTLADSVEVGALAAPQRGADLGAWNVGAFLLLAGLAVASPVGRDVSGGRRTSSRRRPGALTVAAVVVGAAAAGGAGWLALAPANHSPTVLAVAVIGALALAMFAAAAIRLLQRVGGVIVLALGAASVLVSVGADGASAGQLLLPDRWVSQAISDAGVHGTGALTTLSAAVLVCLLLTSTISLVAAGRSLKT